MPTVTDILSQMLNADGQETEKIAAETQAPSQEDDIQKLATEYNTTPEEVKNVMAEIDEEEKRAEAEKQAEEAMVLGRFMARGFVDELQKIGADPGYGSGVGGSEPTTTNQGSTVPQDGSTANRLAQALSAAHGQQQTPKKEELKAALMARRANFQAAGKDATSPSTALETESK